MSMHAEPVRGHSSLILVRPEYAAQVTEASFDPHAWGARARPVDTGGRGSAWFLEDGPLSWMLRSYQRGGMVAPFSKETYWYQGRVSVRSFAEFRLLERLHASGLPVPKPVAAAFWPVAGLWYRARIIVERIPHARPFSETLLSGNDSLWKEVGQLVRLFHDHGVYHADLNCHNILVARSGLYLIDFDKSRFRRDGRWKQANLDRLRRSIDKTLTHRPATEINRRWQELLSGYETSEKSAYAWSLLASGMLVPLCSVVTDLAPCLPIV